MKKVPGQSPADAGLAQRDDVRSLANRCPFCRDDVSQQAQGTVACQTCLTRHHAACWREGGRCSSCAAERVLAPATPRTARRRVLAPLAYTLAGFFLALVMVVGLGAWAVYQVTAGAPAGAPALHRALLVGDGAVVDVTNGTSSGSFLIHDQITDPEQASYEYRYTDVSGATFSGKGVTRKMRTPLGGAVNPRIAFGPFELEWSKSSQGQGWIYPGTTYVRVTSAKSLEALRRGDPSLPYRDGSGRAYSGEGPLPTR